MCALRATGREIQNSYILLTGEIYVFIMSFHKTTESDCWLRHVCLPDRLSVRQRVRMEQTG